VTSWLHQLGEIERSGSEIVLTKEQWDALDEYDSLGQPTNPSVGRCFRTKGGAFCWVEADPAHPDGSYVLRKSLPARIVGSAEEEESEPLDPIKELVEAAQEVSVFLSTSWDPPEPVPAIFMPQAAGLRRAAAEIERRDAAIFRFRKALTAARET
jgi:hypothetical protein